MSDQVYNNLPNDLVSVIAHQEIRNEILKTLSYDIVAAKSMPKINSITKDNLNTKCHSLLEEWIASKNPKLLSKISFGEISSYATKTIDSLLSGTETSLAAIFTKLNEVAYNFQLESEKKHAK